MGLEAGINREVRGQRIGDLLARGQPYPRPTERRGRTGRQHSGARRRVPAVRGSAARRTRRALCCTHCADAGPDGGQTRWSHGPSNALCSCSSPAQYGQELHPGHPTRLEPAPGWGMPHGCLRSAAPLPEGLGPWY